MISYGKCIGPWSISITLLQICPLFLWNSSRVPWSFSLIFQPPKWGKLGRGSEFRFASWSEGWLWGAMHFDSAPDGKMNHNILCFFGDDGWLLYGYIVLLFDRLRDVDHFSVVNILELNQHHQTSAVSICGAGRESLWDEGKETWPQPAERYTQNVMFVPVCQGHNCIKTKHNELRMINKICWYRHVFLNVLWNNSCGTYRVNE